MGGTAGGVPHRGAELMSLSALLRACCVAGGLAGALAVSCGVAVAGSSQTDADSAYQNARDFDLDLFAPSAPGFVVLGLSPRNAADPGSFRNFGFDFADLSRGSVYNLGGALSLEPFWWGNSDLTLKDYEDDTSALERAFARTQVSLAASFVHGPGFQYFSQGLALQTQLLDAQDQRFDPASYRCILEAWQTTRQPAQQAADDAVLDYLTNHPNATDAELKSVRDAVLKNQGGQSAQAFANARTECRGEAELRFLSKPSLMVGVGERAKTQNAGFRSPQLDGGSVWATYRQPLLDDGLLSLEVFGRYAFGETLDVLTSSTTREAKGNEAIGGAGLAFERTWWKLEAAGTFVHQDFETAAFSTQNYGEASLSAAIKVRDGLWLQASGEDVLGGAGAGTLFWGLDVKYDWSSLGL